MTLHLDLATSVVTFSFGCKMNKHPKIIWTRQQKHVQHRGELLYHVTATAIKIASLHKKYISYLQYIIQ